MKLACYYCSKEIVMTFTEEDKLKDSIWFCSNYCKETYINIQINKQIKNLENNKEYHS
jgi:hypothetical protein